MRDFFLKRAPLEVNADINRRTSVDRRNAPGAGTRKQRATKTETLLSGHIDFSHSVDFVITWVDGADPEFIEQRRSYQEHDTSGKVAANNVARYQSRDEIRYCVRSMLTYAPWLRKIYIVTNGQVPHWLDESQDRVVIVRHSEIIDAEYLPTFNSHVIESCLHKIPGLSEHFVYFNDDVLLLKPVSPTNFFTENGLMRGFVSSAKIPNGPPHSGDTPSMVAIKNARAMLFGKLGYSLNAKFAHTYHPQRKSVSQACEAAFAQELALCRANKFRNLDDVLCTSFLFPCFAYINGHGVFSRVRAWYFNIRDTSAINLYTMLLNFKEQADGPVSVCLNDHLPDNLAYNFKEYECALTSFLDSYYPMPSPCELDVTPMNSYPAIAVEPVLEQVE